MIKNSLAQCSICVHSNLDKIKTITGRYHLKDQNRYKQFKNVCLGFQKYLSNLSNLFDQTVKMVLFLTEIV